MRKALAGLAAAALIWTSGPCWAMGEIRASNSGPGSGVRVAVPGAPLTPALESQLRQIKLYADSPGKLAGFFAAALGPEAKPEQAAAGLALASALVRPELASGFGQALPQVSEEARLAVAEAVQGRGYKLLETPEALNSHLKASEQAAVSKLQAAAGESGDALFDNGRPKAAGAEPSATRESEGKPSGLLPAKSGGLSGDRAASRIPTPATWTPSQRNLFRGIFSSGLGQAFNTSLLANLAFADYGSGFAAMVMFFQLGSTIPGGWVGAWWVHKFGSKSAYLRMTPVYAAGLFSLFLAHAWLGWVPRAHYLAFASIAEIIYGAQRGVAEQDITARMAGRDEVRLEKANAANASWISLAYVMGSGFVALLLPMVGAMPLLLMGALVMLPSLYFYSRIDLPFKRSEAGGGTEESARRSPSQFLPYIFFWGMYLMFYGVTPLLALETLHWSAGTAWSLLAYELGIQAGTRLPFFNRLSRRWNTILAAGATSSFLLGTLWSSNPLLYLVLTGALGAFLISGLNKWKAFYQNMLPEDQRPAFFRWLNDWSMLAALLPFAVSCVNFFFPVVPMIPLLWAQAGIVAAASALLAILSYRGSSDHDSKAGPKSPGP